MEITEAGVSGPEIVDTDRNTGFFDPFEHFDGAFGILHHGAFGYFKF